MSNRFLIIAVVLFLVVNLALATYLLQRSSPSTERQAAQAPRYESIKEYEKGSSRALTIVSRIDGFAAEIADSDLLISELDKIGFWKVDAFYTKVPQLDLENIAKGGKARALPDAVRTTTVKKIIVALEDYDEIKKHFAPTAIEQGSPRDADFIVTITDLRTNSNLETGDVVLSFFIRPNALNNKSREELSKNISLSMLQTLWTTVLPQADRQNSQNEDDSKASLEFASEVLKKTPDGIVLQILKTPL